MENYREVRFVLIYTMLLNLVATAAKILVGWLTGSLSILADGFDSLFDSVSNVVGLIAILLARRPPSKDHPYGHRRYEILMTLIIAVMLFATCFQILRSAYDRLMHPTNPVINIWSFASLLVSIAVHVYVTVYEERRGRELKSEFLVSDALHTKADIFVSVGVMAGLVVVRLGYSIIDTLLAVVIAFLIAKIGFEIIRGSTRILTDAAAVDASKIEALALQVPGVESCHEIRSRGQEDDIYVDLHIRVAPQMPLTQAHQIAHEVQSRIERAIEGVSDVVIHIEPQPGSTDGQGNDIFVRMKRIAAELGVPVHHLNAHEIEGHYVVNVHLEVPEGLTLGQAHRQATLLENRVKTEIPGVAEISTHLEPLARARVSCEASQDDAQLAASVQEIVGRMRQVRDCHDVSVLRVNGKLFVTLHCTLDENLPIAEAHDISTVIEERLRRECPNLAGVTVHVEPSEVGAPS